VTGDLEPRRNLRLGNPEWCDNWTVGSGLRMEFIDGLGRVWLCQEPISEERARSLSLPEGATLALLGGALADAAFFRRSPGATADGPLEVMEVDGMRFSFVARPMAHQRLASVTVMSIDKHHTMLYAAGRVIDVLDFGDGSFATPAWASPKQEDAHAPEQRGSDLPNGWALRTAELTDDLAASIPNPAKVAILADGSGFHGPLSMNQHASVRILGAHRDTNGEPT